MLLPHGARDPIRLGRHRTSLAVTGQYLDHIGANELSDRMRGEDWGLWGPGEDAHEATRRMSLEREPQQYRARAISTKTRRPLR